MLTIFSWNINGIRALDRKNIWNQFLKDKNPDFLCLQEIKAKDHQIEVNTDGYRALWYPAEKPGYSGTAILSKIKPSEVRSGFPKDTITKFKLHGDIYGDPNKEGRVLAAEYPNFWLVSVYTPNAKDDLSRIPLKYKQWDPAFLDYMLELEKAKPVIFCGDLNVAHKEEDLANPQKNIGKKGFTNEEREGIQKLIDNGFVDSFRLFKKGNGYYTWWTHFARARERNVGWRIDYILVSSKLKNNIIDAAIYPEIMGSDHCPVSVTLDL